MITNSKTYLSQKAALIRKETVKAVCHAASGHPGGSLSIADLLAVLYFDKMNIDPENPQNPDRDRLVLSKGHAAPSYYSALALRGYFSTEELKNLRQIGSFLQGHPDMNKVPGVDMSSGSLGQGLSAANGMALGAKASGRSYQVYCILGDGETQEGQVWEAVMTAAHYKLDNLTVFLDQNGLQIDGPVANVKNNAPYEEKFSAFGWNVLTIDGHDIEQIGDAIDKAKSAKGRPTIIICHTIKGKGVSYMENQCGWHGAAPDEEQAAIACRELDEAFALTEVV